MDKMIAVVTGGTGGIGTAICRALAQDYKVVACYYKNGRHEDAKRWQQEQKAQGYDIDIVYGDVRKFEDCEKIVASVQERFGRLDVLVNNAGVTRDSTLKKMSEEQWDRVIGVNLKGVYNCTRAFVDTFLAQGNGAIVNISSVVGVYGNFGQTNYAAAKAGVLGMTKTWSKELGRKGVRANAICPGFIATPILSSMPENVLKAMESEVPLGRMGEPAEIAAVAAFLLSKDASYVNGAVLEVSGGLTI